MRALAVAALAACSGSRAPHTIDPHQPARVHFATPAGDVVLAVEVADTPDTISRGLMHRTALAADTGMIFFMERDKNWSFWMHDTLIPLDMMFVSRELEVVGIVERAEPRTDTSRRVGALSRYVIEASGGWAAAHGVRKGTPVRFENLRP